MLDRFAAHWERCPWGAENPRIVLGYSGGADSTCLLHLMHRLGLELVAAHLHHGQRPEADLELRLCEGFCRELEVPFVSGRADVPRIARDHGIGLEEAGRNARYHFLFHVANSVDATYIATAHTLTDHVETVLLNMVRGTGLAGIAGIPVQRENIIRPLLGFTRSETQDYCSEHGLWFHNDPANEDLQLSRARLRHRVLPELRLVHPHAEDGIAKLASIAAAEDQFLRGAAAAALEHAILPLNGHLQFVTLDCEVAFHRSAIAALPEVLRHRAIRQAAESLGETMDQNQTVRVSQGVAGEGYGSVTLDGGRYVLEWDDARLHVREVQPAGAYRYNLTMPGETVSESFGWAFTAFPSESICIANRSDLTVQINPAAIKGPLYFRSAEPGDTIDPVGFSGHRKVSDLMGEARMTHAARVRLPVVCDLVGPIWVPGICYSHRVRVSEDLPTAIQIEFGPASAG